MAATLSFSDSAKKWLRLGFNSGWWPGRSSGFAVGVTLREACHSIAPDAKIVHIDDDYQAEIWV